MPSGIPQWPAERHRQRHRGLRLWVTMPKNLAQKCCSKHTIVVVLTFCKHLHPLLVLVSIPIFYLCFPNIPGLGSLVSTVAQKEMFLFCLASFYWLAFTYFCCDQELVVLQICLTVSLCTWGAVSGLFSGIQQQYQHNSNILIRPGSFKQTLRIEHLRGLGDSLLSLCGTLKC